MTTPIKPGTRYEIPAPAQDDAELKQLDDLINFLGDVKDSARLRAKEENGVKFLHTRTGTPLGRFWKWLTVGWPGAMEQRKEFRASIKDVLKNIQSSGISEIDVIKLRISQQTLRVRMFTEFDVHQLRNDLKVLRALVKSREKESTNPAPPSDSSMDKKPPVMIVMAKQGVSDSESESLSQDEPVFVSVTELTEKSVPVGGEVDTEGKESPLEDLPLPSSESSSAVSNASIEMPAFHEYSGDELPNEPNMVTQKLAVSPEAKAIESTWPESKKFPAQQLKTQPVPRQLNAKPFPKTTPLFDLEQNSPSEKGETPVTSAAAAPERKIAEGKLEIFHKANSGSRYAIIRLLDADAYVFPSGGNVKDPNERLLSEPLATTAIGVKVFRGTLADDASSRSWGMLVMEGPESDVSAEQKANALYAQYISTLEEAIAMRIAENKSVQTIAIRPWKDRLLSDMDALTLIRSVNRFREQHPGINILIVPSAVGEDRKLQAAVAKVGKDSAPPFASASS